MWPALGVPGHSCEITLESNVLCIGIGYFQKEKSLGRRFFSRHVCFSGGGGGWGGLFGCWFWVGLVVKYILACS